MKYIVVSDIHGSMYYLDKIIEIINKEKIDKIILLGDLYYHGPRNPLPEGYTPMDVCFELNKFKDKIICIKGNCDALVDETISDFPFNESQELTINNTKFYLTHGHVINEDNIPDNVDVLMYGHFHKCFIKEKDNTIIVNPGSISLPKDNTPHSFAIIDDDKITIYDIDLNEIDSINYLKK